MISPEALDLIKRYEGFYAKRYICPAGVPTIGYGTIRWWDGGPIPEGAEVTREEAERLLMRDVSSTEARIRAKTDISVGSLTSFAYNLGCGALFGSTLWRKHMDGDFTGASEEFKRWNKGGGRVLRGLVVRREDERRLYEKETQDGMQETEGETET